MRLKCIFVCILTSIIIACVIWLRETRAPVLSPVQEGAYQKIFGVITFRKNPELLKKQITDTIGDSWKNYSVYVTDLNSNFSLGINEHETFTAASINKLPILAAIYYNAQKGNIDFDKIITLQTEDIQDYGTGSIRYDPPGSTYSIKTLVRLMMQKSDNTAAYLLGNAVVDLPSIQNMVQNWGMMQTDMINNKTSNFDIALLLTKIYHNNIANPAATSEMLGFMRDSDFEDRLPGALPKDVLVYHKIGNGDTGEIHDVGIIVHGTTAYYVGILTTNVPDPDAAARLEAKISKIIYDFMN